MINILVAGSAGFIFSNFVRRILFLRPDIKIASIDKIIYLNTLSSIYLNGDHSFYIGDITDKHFIDVVFTKEKPDYVINGAAFSFVDDGIKDTYPFINSNVLGTQVLIDACLKYQVKKFVQISCYDEKTRAVTKNGFKHYSELNEGDLVLSINPDTGVVEEKPIKKIIVQDYNGEMCWFSNKRAELLTTPNHRFLTTKLRSNELSWTTAQDLEKDNEKHYLPTGIINKDNIEKIELPEIGPVNAEALFYLCGVFIGDGFTAHQKKISLCKTGLTRSEYLKNFTRDSKTGRIVKGDRKGLKKINEANSYRIFFDVPENDKARKSLKEALIKLNITFSAHKGKSGEHIYFSSKSWLNFFDTFGKYAKNKHIPEWMFNYGTKLLTKLWRGIHDSDGHGFEIDNRGTTITTISDKLCGQLCYLGEMIGYQTRFSKNHNISYINERKIEGDCYIIYFSNELKVLMPKPQRITYSGKIWCLTVEDNKNFLVERNGKIAFSGNTDEVLGGAISENDPKRTEDSPLNPRNAYAASKAAAEMLVKIAGDTHGLKYNITRSCNNFGPRQLPRNLIPKVIKNILKKEPVPIYGTGAQIREWIYVDDCVDAILCILEKGLDNEIYHISTGNEISNLELFNKICNEMGQGHDLLKFVEDRKMHDFRYAPDSTKLRSLGWSPNKKFIDGLKDTIAWYINNQNWWFKNC